MIKYILLLIILDTIAYAGLPPTSTKFNGDANPVTTFEFDFPNATVTHTGTKASFGTLGIAGGGTGQVTANAALNALLPSQGGNNTKFLQTDGSNTSWASAATGTVTSVAATVPAFLSISGSPITTSGTLAFTLSGTALPIANGGTAGTSAAAAFNNLNPMTTTGDTIYESGASTASRLAIGTTGQILTVAGGVPVWATGTATSAVAAVVTGLASNSTYTANTAIKFPTVVKDTNSAYSTGTGQFTAPVTGFYYVSAQIVHGGSGSGNYLYAAVAGSAYGPAISNNYASGGYLAGATTVYATSGQTIDVRYNASTTIQDGSPELSGLAIFLVQGNTGDISARYFASSTTISGSLATINYTTKDYDTNSAYSSGTFTVPAGGAGKYQVNAALLVAGTIALNNQIVMEIQKNGSVVSRKTINLPATLSQEAISISDSINCADADTLRIQVSTSATAPTIVSSNFDNYVSLVRVGN